MADPRMTDAVAAQHAGSSTEAEPVKSLAKETQKEAQLAQWRALEQLRAEAASWDEAQKYRARQVQLETELGLDWATLAVEAMEAEERRVKLELEADAAG